MLRVGLIARSEDRGLGNLCLEVYRHLQPDKTLLVVPAGVARHGLTSHRDRYPDATVIGYDGKLSERNCREWLTDLDVVYSAETYYDWRFCRWAREAKVATVCHAMPEFCRPEWAAEPTEWWAPTTWRLDSLPQGTRHVPVPIATDRFTAYERNHEPFRWLHVAGAQTDADRNGTAAVLRAAHILQERQEIVVRSQTGGIDGHASEPATLIPEIGNVTDYWRMYDHVDALVMPRRYAGLCLPVLEAMGAGLPVVMTDLEPQNRDWPVKTVKTDAGKELRIFGGIIPTGDADIEALATTMDEWATNPAEVNAWRAASRDYADAHSWERWAPKYQELLAEAALVVA